MTLRRTAALLLLAPLALVVLPVTAATPAGATTAQGGEVNDAVAVNTEDGGSVFRLALSLRYVADGVVDQENLAIAYASCTDCQTVALAFQVVLVMGGASTVVPTNEAIAVNDECVECLTYASATQIVISVDGPVVLTSEGRRRLRELEARLRDLEDRLPELTPAQLITEVEAVEAELLEVLETELVPAGQELGPAGTEGGDATTSTSTTAQEADVTTTTVESTTTSVDAEGAPVTSEVPAPTDSTGG